MKKPSQYVFLLYIACVFLLIIFIRLFHINGNALAYSAPYTGTKGINALLNLENLPYIRTGTTLHEVSSYDRTGKNDDGNGYFLYRNPNTQGYVVLEEFKPGTIFRIWETAVPAEGRIKIYVDGESNPKIDLNQHEFFSGTKAPFLSPLVGNSIVSSGGYYSYYPISFAKSIRVEFTQVPNYYQITYHLYNDADGIVSYTGNEDLSSVVTSWNNPFRDPKSTAGNTSFPATEVALASGETKTIAELSGAGSIRSITMNFPAFALLSPTPSVNLTVTDNGKAFTSSSTFIAKIDPNNTGVVLTRRLDYSIANQKSEVYVDGSLVGTWFNGGYDAVSQWRNSDFSIPESFTHGKTKITVKIKFVSSTIDWNEFYYWIKSSLPSGDIVTDELDVGTASSESSHSYSVERLDWEGTRTFSYPGVTATDTTIKDTLNDIFIKIYWDDETSPSVNVPVSFFFGVGASGEALLKGLLLGVDPTTHTYYNFFPMPYGKRAKIELTNTGNSQVSGASFQLQYNSEPYTDLGSRVGYFTAIYNNQNPTIFNKDYVMADISSGKGTIVGTILSASDQGLGYLEISVLEGDHRIFIDTKDFNPAMHGTGTEDFFNGGYYFSHGIFTLPLQGNTVNDPTGIKTISMYRLNPYDAFTFENSIAFKIEHGGYNEFYSKYESAIFAYVLKDKNLLTQTDSLQVGSSSDEVSHHYTISGQTWQGNIDSSFIGRDDNAKYVGSGRAHKGSSRFTVTILPTNSGVRLGRILDMKSGNQKANIYVDGALVGVWYTGGSNETFRAYYDYFEIPAAVTAGKSRIQIRTEFISADIDWNEFKYFAFSHQDPTDAQPTLTPTPTPSSRRCAQVMVYARNPQTDICTQFGSPCEIPAGWSSCSPSGTPVLLPSPTSSVTPTPTPSSRRCAQAISYARNPQTGVCTEFGSSCSIPAGWAQCSPLSVVSVPTPTSKPIPTPTSKPTLTPTPTSKPTPTPSPTPASIRVTQTFNFSRDMNNVTLKADPSSDYKADDLLRDLAYSFCAEKDCSKKTRSILQSTDVFTTISRWDASSRSYVVHKVKANDGNNFSIRSGVAYRIYVKKPGSATLTTLTSAKK